ncbi:Retrovirus-related Pol polyprotein from transposon TNT 1-94 [Dendrobium catenatum]|uniref:Retrovirus-related Pol polyprotein from transposon TNT 1-94 n=1 Tax=Dendrobium catenatum TaxID=906689 RepID=A0A2I0V9R8_9ASPA|nr:Retrovirus-related Pol polyprotein from transposon TNT 1-94 [Dendrobium catenatum]
MVEKQFSTHIKIFRSDGGGEYTSTQFQNFLSTNGILHQFSCPHTPQQNGLAERKHRHIIETARTLLLQAKLPTSFWVESVLTAVYLINRLPSPITKYISPFQCLYKTPPSYSHLKIFGCLCYPWLQPAAPNKFAPKSSACVFIGYSSTHKGFRCYNLHTSKILISRHVQFHENIFPFHNISSSNSDLPSSSSTPIISPLTLVPHTHDQHASPQPQSSSHSPSPSPLPIPTRHRMVTRLQTGKLKPKPVFNLQHSLIDEPDPTCFTTASKHKCWRDAMSAEFQALQQQGTWELVKPPSSQTILGCKWIYKTKRASDGTIARYKARLVAQGYRQEYGIDYTETFSPVAKFPTIRLFITTAVIRKWSILQLDVSNAFLHGDLNEEVYMHQPPGFRDPQYPDFVCRLHKAIYGLKQSPRQWFAKLTTHLQSLGFRHSEADPSLLVYAHNSHLIYFLIYVDDILVTGSNSKLIADLLLSLQQQFQIRNLGPLTYFLGIQAASTSTGYHLHQTKYAVDILNRAGMANCNPVLTPFPSKMSLDDKAMTAFENPEFYRHLVGSLQYLTITRPDLAYAVNKLCQFMHSPLCHHFHALKHLLRYIKGTVDLGLPITGHSSTLSAYVDSDWAGDPTDRKSTTGYCLFIGDTPLSWCVKKQPTVAKSSTEAEYRALSTAATDIIWIRRLMADFRFNISTPTTLYCDNVSAIALAHNPVFHARTKHIEVDYHFIRDCIKSATLTLLHINSQDQLADIFTKALPRLRFADLRSKLQVTHTPSA